MNDELPLGPSSDSEHSVPHVLEPECAFSGDGMKGESLPGIRSLARTMIKGVGLLVAAGVISRLFSLVSSPILTRLVGPSPYGILALVGTVSSLAGSVALVGIDFSYARFFFVGCGEHGPAVERFCWRFALTLGILFSLAAGLAWWIMIPSGSAHRNLAIVVSLTTLAAVISVMAVSRQRIRGAYSRIAASIIVGGGSGVLLSILLAWLWRPDAWAMVLGTLAGSILSLCILGIPGGSVLLQRSNLDFERRWELLSLGFACTVTAPMFWVISSADRWLLGIWEGAGAVGVYAFAASIGLSGMMVNGAVSLAWFPEVSREFEQTGEGAPSNIARLWARLAGLHMVTWLAVASFGGDVIRLLSDSRFHSGAQLVPWIAGGVFFYGIAGLATTGLFLKKDMKPAALWWTLGAVFNVACNVLLIGPLGLQGASVAVCLSFAFVMIGLLWSAQSRLRLPLPWRRLGAAATVTLIAGSLLHPPWSSSPLVSLLLKLPVGILTGAVLGVGLAPDWAQRLFKWKRIHLFF